MKLMTTNKTTRTIRNSTTITGAKYAHGRDIADIAKLVREDIKRAVAARTLPAAKYRAIISRYSMGRSLDIVVDALPASFPIFNAKRLAFDAANPHASHVGLPLDVLSLYSPEYDALREQLEAIANAYNEQIRSNEADDGDHVSFHLHISLHSNCRAAARTRETAAAQLASAPVVESAPSANDSAPAPSHVDFLAFVGAL